MMEEHIKNNITLRRHLYLLFEWVAKQNVYTMIHIYVYPSVMMQNMMEEKNKRIYYISIIKTLYVLFEGVAYIYILL